MNKKVKLVMVPFKPDKLEIGMYLQKIKNGVLINEFTTAGESSLQHQHKMGFEWRPVEPYLISDDEVGLNELCIFSIRGNLMEAYPDDLLGPNIEWVRKVIAIPEQITSVILNDSGYDFTGMPCVGTKEENITFEHIKEILKNDGNCNIKISEDKQIKIII